MISGATVRSNKSGRNQSGNVARDERAKKPHKTMPRLGMGERDQGREKKTNL